MTGAPGTNPPAASDPWTDFERRLAEALARMAPETYLILEVPDPDGEARRYVQFARGVSGFRAEAVSSHYLPPSGALTRSQERRLAGLGWKRPAPAVDARNFHVDWDGPAPLADVARLAVRTLREIYGVEAPSGLRYRHESFRNQPVSDLDLGIESRSGRTAPGEAPVTGPTLAEVGTLVEDAVGRWLGVELPVRDEDGDYPIRVGSALMFVRLLPGRPPAVAVFAPILRDVPRTADLLIALNELNSRIRFGRVFWAEGQVMVAAELTAAGISADQIAFACVEIGNLADNLDDALHGRFGGKTVFEGGPTRPN